ncbi:MAG: hypothetical protein BWK72_19535, partial [Rhodoferax ferrireducens]
MDRTERFYKIDNLLQAHTVVPIERFLRELEVSPATFKRDLEYMRDRLNAPIQWSKADGGYSYLGAWCHKQEAMRSFSMDAIQHASVLAKTSKSLPKKELDGFIGQGYAIARPMPAQDIPVWLATWRSPPSWLNQAP